MRSFYTLGQGLPSLRPHHDGPHELLFVQQQGSRIVKVWPPPHDEREHAIRAFNARGRPPAHEFSLRAGQVLYLPAYTPHAVVAPEVSISFTVAIRREKRSP